MLYRNVLNHDVSLCCVFIINIGIVSKLAGYEIIVSTYATCAAGSKSSAVFRDPYDIIQTASGDLFVSDVACDALLRINSTGK